MVAGTWIRVRTSSKRSSTQVSLVGQLRRERTSWQRRWNATSRALLPASTFAETVRHQLAAHTSVHLQQGRRAPKRSGRNARSSAHGMAPSLVEEPLEDPVPTTVPELARPQEGETRSSSSSI
jgi:hypothetical protein